MSGDAFHDVDPHGVDVDLLADYVDGALAGTPREAAVAALVADDPRWRAVHATLTAELPAVRDALHALGAAAPAMPAELSARLDAVFAGPAGAAPAPADDAPAQRPHLVAVGGTGAGPGPARRRPGRRRLLRTAGPLAAAAALAGIAAVGVSQITGGDGDATSASRDAGAAAGEAAAPAAAGANLAAPPGADRITSTGTDYRADTLAAAGAGTTVKSAPTGGFAAPDRIAGGLERLRGTTALGACLDAVARANDAGAVRVEAVEYARYAGTPAVLVRFTAANGTWVWAAGADCGTPGAGPATLASTRVR